MQFCPQCGSKLDENAVFCDKCRYKVKENGNEYKTQAYINFRRLPGSVAKLVSTKISIDGVLVASLKENEVQQIKVSYGDHKIKIKVNGSPSLQICLSIQEGMGILDFPFKIGNSSRPQYCGNDQSVSLLSNPKRSMQTVSFGFFLTIAVLIVITLFLLSLNDSSKLSESDEGNEITIENQTDQSKTTTIKETILYDKNNIVVTSQKIEFTQGAYDLKVLIENNSNEKLDADIKNVTVNDYMMQDPLGDTINPGNKAIVHVWIDSNWLDASGITEIADIEFDICFRNSENRKEVFCSTPRNRIETSNFPNHEYEFDNSGTLVYDKDGLSIISKNTVSNSFSQFGPSALFYVENTSDDTFYIMYDDVSVNSFMVSTYARSFTILPGKHAIISVDFVKESLKENGIESIDSMQFCFTILKNELYFSTSDENNTDLITINF